jgi:hypothetical protein
MGLGTSRDAFSGLTSALTRHSEHVILWAGTSETHQRWRLYSCCLMEVCRDVYVSVFLILFIYTKNYALVMAELLWERSSSNYFYTPLAEML